MTSSGRHATISRRARLGAGRALRLDENSYPKAIRVTDAEMADLNVETDEWHPEWKYTIRPRPSG
jgi:hypothetical protein